MCGGDVQPSAKVALVNRWHRAAAPVGPALIQIPLHGQPSEGSV